MDAQPRPGYWGCGGLPCGRCSGRRRGAADLASCGSAAPWRRARVVGDEGLDTARQHGRMAVKAVRGLVRDGHRRWRYGGIGACQLQAHFAYLNMPRDRVVRHRRLQRRQRVQQGVLLRHETEQQDCSSAEPSDGGALATCRLHAAMLAESPSGAGDSSSTAIMARRADLQHLRHC